MAEDVAEPLGDLGADAGDRGQRAAPAGAAAARFGSRFRIQKMRPPEATKLIASSRTAIGAPSRPTSPPPSGWPRTWAAEPLIWSFELPSMRSSGSRIAGRNDWSATSKKTVSVPLMKPTM